MHYLEFSLHISVRSRNLNPQKFSLPVYGTPSSLESLLSALVALVSFMLSVVISQIFSLQGFCSFST